MPEAVASNSIPVSEGQSWAADLDDFYKTIHQIEALTMMLSATFEQSSAFHSSISNGICGLFRSQAYDLRQIFQDVTADQKKLQELSAYDHAIAKLHSNVFDVTDKETKFNASEIAEESKRINVGTQLHPLTKQALERAAAHYDREIEKMASIIVFQWVVREGWLTLSDIPEQTADHSTSKPSKSLVRDQFIYDCHSRGLDTSEIAQVFNIKRRAVDKVIARLTPSESSNKQKASA